MGRVCCSLCSGIRKYAVALKFLLLLLTVGRSASQVNDRFSRAKIFDHAGHKEATEEDTTANRRLLLYQPATDTRLIQAGRQTTSNGLNPRLRLGENVSPKRSRLLQSFSFSLQNRQTKKKPTRRHSTQLKIVSFS